jgi:hypothetical protein
MGAGAFTTWSDLARTMRDDLASGNFRTVSSYTLPGGSGYTFRTMKEFLELLSMVEQRAAEESGGFDGYIITTTAGRF